MKGCLYLHPLDPRRDPPATARVVAALRTTGMIGTSLGEGRFRVGERFPHGVIFAGCSPNLTFEPHEPGSQGFCHFAIVGPFPQPRMVTGAHTLNPRCPHCGQRLADWHPLKDAWEATPGEAAWRCSGCSRVTPIDAWRWRRRAAFGRLLVAVRGVFPAEAVPADWLLDALADSSGGPWDYAWADAID